MRVFTTLLLHLLPECHPAEGSIAKGYPSVKIDYDVLQLVGLSRNHLLSTRQILRVGKLTELPQTVSHSPSSLV